MLFLRRSRNVQHNCTGGDYEYPFLIQFAMLILGPRLIPLNVRIDFSLSPGQMKETLVI